MKYIVSDPQIMDGAPVIAGTRIPIEQIMLLIKDGYNLDAIHKEYPQVDRRTLEGVIDDLNALIKTQEREDSWQGYDAKRVVEALSQVAGSWADIDTDTMIKTLYAARVSGSRLAPKP